MEEAAKDARRGEEAAKDAKDARMKAEKKAAAKKAKEEYYKSHKEELLSDDVFQKTFGMTKEAFKKLPGWKKTRHKKQHGLF